MQKRPEVEPTSYIHMPPRAITVSVDEYERRISSPRSLTWGMEKIDDRVIPPMPGDLISILGRPGMGKTTIMVFLAKRFSGIANQKLLNVERPLFIYATWETMVEEFMGVFSAQSSGFTLEDIGRGNADLAKIKRAMVHSMGLSVAVFGRSMPDARTSIPTPTLFNLSDAIKILNDMGHTVVGVFIDYLQQIPGLHYNDRRDDRSARSSENLAYIKEVGIATGTFMIVGCQARREVDDYGGLKFPQLSDGQWTSTIEQASDKVFSITIPVKYLPEGTEITIGRWEYAVTDSMMGIRMLKQRFGPASDNDVWLLDLNMATADASLHDTIGEVGNDDVIM